MKTKANHSQVLELIFPKMYQVHPWPSLTVQPDPLGALSAAGAWHGRLFMWNENCVHHVEAPVVSHDFCIFLPFIPQGWNEGGGGDLWFPAAAVGFFISCFLSSPNILEIFPKQLLLL